MKISMAILFYFFSVFSVWADQVGFTGTEDRPVPLVGTYQQIPYVLFFHSNGIFRITHDDVVVMAGNWKESETSVFFSPSGFANKVFVTSDGNRMVCLQSTFYQGPREWRYKADIFCPVSSM